jgi:hypothetical protein
MKYVVIGESSEATLDVEGLVNPNDIPPRP